MSNFTFPNEFRQYTGEIEYKGDKIPIHFTIYPGEYGLDIELRLTKLLLPLLTPMLKSKEDTESFSFANLFEGATMELLLKNISKIRSEEVIHLIGDILKFVTLGGKKLKDKTARDFVFSGRQKLLFKVLTLVLKENLEDFFDEGGIGEILSGLKMPPEGTLNLN